MGFEKGCFSWALLVIRQSSRNWWFYSEAVCGLGLLKTLEMYLTQGLYFCMCFFLSTVLNLSWWFSLILKTILRARSIIIPFRWGNWGLGRSRNLSKVISGWTKIWLQIIPQHEIFVHILYCLHGFVASQCICFWISFGIITPSLYKKFCILLDQEFLTLMAYES